MSAGGMELRELRLLPEVQNKGQFLADEGRDLESFAHQLVEVAPLLDPLLGAHPVLPGGVRPSGLMTATGAVEAAHAPA
jgi:hypothetical protein